MDVALLKQKRQHVGVCNHLQSMSWPLHNWPVKIRLPFAGIDDKGCRLFEASGLSLLYDVDEWQPNSSFQHHDAGDWHLSALVHHLQRQAR